MKTTVLKSITIICLLFISGSVLSQDIIYKLNKDIIVCKVIELEELVVKYTQEQTGTIVYSLEKSAIEKIVLENGKELTFQNSSDSKLASSSDKIYKKNKDVILCTIIELGEEEIKYTTEESGTLVYALNKDAIEQVVLQNGETLTFKNKMMDAEYYADNNKNAFKFGFFNPLAQNLKFGYERSLGPGKSFEVAFGFGWEDRAGVNFKAGYKFILSPDFYLQGMKYSHLLKGWYFRPAINIAVNEFGPAGMIGLDWGKQIVLSNVFLVDYFIGAGFGAGGGGWYNGFGGAEGGVLYMSAGFNVGFLTK
jgi:hypothetical protein